ESLIHHRYLLAASCVLWTKPATIGHGNTEGLVIIGGRANDGRILLRFIERLLAHNLYFVPKAKSFKWNPGGKRCLLDAGYCLNSFENLRVVRVDLLIIF